MQSRAMQYDSASSYSTTVCMLSSKPRSVVPVSVKKHSFYESLCLATQQHKLVSSSLCCNTATLQLLIWCFSS